jgi:dienelactone hydrolase
MGFSRGGGAALYASVKRFQKIWSTSESEAAAYIALYPTCNTIYIDDERVSEHPIRMFHGIPDDYVEITPCRNYYQRLKAKAKDIEMTEFPDTWHAYDYVGYPMVPTVVPPAQTTHCALFEDPVGRIINTATDQPFSYNDACVGRGPHVAYSPAATHATEERVKILLKNVFRVD